MKYKVLIVDDEEPARDLMVAYAGKIDQLEIIGVVNNALAAKKIIQTEGVDILLSDIQMDDLTGIELLKMLKHPPVTIFTTAYSEYALEGYDLDIIDYLVKPISFQRFCKAIDKATELIQFSQHKEIEEEKISPASSDFFFVKTNRKIVKVNYQDILFVESYGEYVKIYTKDDVLLALQSTTFMEKTLPQQDFVRIHRSHIININQIKEIAGNEVFIEQHRLSISKRMKDGFMQRIKARGII